MKIPTATVLAWAIPALFLAQSNRADLGSDELERYFAERVAALEDPLAAIADQDDWEAHRKQLQDQLHEMLGLKPLPRRTDLNPVITGTIERDDFRVEKLHFQSRPGLYVTANLYLPSKQGEGPFPSILYVCGHARVKENGVSYGNKVGYHHHGVWFARQGYVCLLIDTIQLGEIEGMHHGTFRYDKWWWNARGYSPAGVEAWNAIRALDYLESRPEVDRNRLGVTGRSGGGAYSWWTATLDPRIKAAVPVAGITSLRNHVVDGCIEGHCDCMFPVNTFRWDFANVAALVSPRPLLISNTDKDRIFPLDGVMEVFWQTKRIYDLQGAGTNLGLNIEEGPHTDTQPLRTSAFHWFNRYLRDGDIKSIHEMAATKVFKPEELKVFKQLPSDEKVTTIDETFVPIANKPAVP
ncbi:MAG: alpha/beta hydrolase family protein, partial [Verrucomicrobiota bacterium]